MNALQTEIAKAALNKMVEGGHFSICVVDEILKITKGIPFREDYETLRLLHCVNFRDFSQLMRIEFPALLQRVLESPSMELEIRFRPLERPTDFTTTLLRLG